MVSSCAAVVKRVEIIALDCTYVVCLGVVLPERFVLSYRVWYFDLFRWIELLLYIPDTCCYLVVDDISLSIALRTYVTLVLGLQLIRPRRGYTEYVGTRGQAQRVPARRRC